ncbi:(2Fe-2S) ferredoxin domain-containing protein [Varunaivibrio sulfuroxidans]|nr:(2Fe-2S) ferredoxin domain-containing protein [Varunaivibrio sulfuroxidans]
MNRQSDDPALFYRCHVFCCTNQRPENHSRGSCAGRGGVRLRNYMKARTKELKIDNVRINSAGCLDRCELGPVLVIYPEGVWYRVQNKEDVDEILIRHLIEGTRVTRCLIAPEDGPAPPMPLQE